MSRTNKVEEWLAEHAADGLQAARVRWGQPFTNPLFGAAAEGRLEVVQWLASNGGSVHGQCDFGASPLYVAAHNGHLNVVEWLAGNGGSVTLSRDGGFTPLWTAAKEGHLEVVRWLAGNGASVTAPAFSFSGETPLVAAALQGHFEVVRWLAGNGGSVTQPDQRGRTPLYIAAANGNLEAVQWLADNGGSVTKPDSRGTTPLEAASGAYKPNSAVVDFITTLAADRAAAFARSLLAPVASGDGWTNKVEEWLAEHGAASVTQPNDAGKTPLCIAACSGHLEIVQLLAANGASVTQSNNDGWHRDGPAITPLIVAARKGHLEIVQWLADNGASVTQPNNNGYTPLYIAAENGHLEVVQLLAANGASVTKPCGKSPLWAAAENGHIKVVQWLAGNGASVTQPDGYGRTPLYIAAGNGHLEVVQWLAANGASLTQPDKRGCTPLEAARSWNKTVRGRQHAAGNHDAACDVADFIASFHNRAAFARSLFLRPLDPTTTLAAPRDFRTMGGDSYTIHEYPVDPNAPQSELQRKAWTAAAQAMGEPAEVIYFISPDDLVVLYRPRITVLVRRVIAGEPAAETVEVELATECGTMEDRTNPTTVDYALAAIGKAMRMPADAIAEDWRLTMPDGHTLGQDDRQRTLEAAGFADGVEVLFATAALGC